MLRVYGLRLVLLWLLVLDCWLWFDFSVLLAGYVCIRILTWYVWVCGVLDKITVAWRWISMFVDCVCWVSAIAGFLVLVGFRFVIGLFWLLGCLWW